MASYEKQVYNAQRRKRRARRHLAAAGILAVGAVAAYPATVVGAAALGIFTLVQARRAQVNYRKSRRAQDKADHLRTQAPGHPSPQDLSADPHVLSRLRPGR